MSTDDLFEDDEDAFRPGRLSREDEYLFAEFGIKRYSRGRSRPIARNMAGKKRDGAFLQNNTSFVHRSLTASSSWKRSDGPEVVVKSAGTSKSKNGVLNMVRYIARLRKEDGRAEGKESALVYDEYGSSLHIDEIVPHMESWDLVDDEFNLSKAERDRRKGLTPMSLMQRRDKGKLRNIQGWHFVMSIRPEGDLENETLVLTRAVRSTVDEMFTREGYRAIWGIHLDQPEHPHAHVIVEAKSQLGRRIRCDKAGDYLQSVRTCFANQLCLAGMPHQATRREDRRDLRPTILRGEERLRVSRPIDTFKRGTTSLKVRCPNWWQEFGARKNTTPQSSRGQAKPEKEDKPSPLRKVWSSIQDRQQARRTRKEEQRCPPEYIDLYRAFSEIYVKPIEAVWSWVGMAREGAFTKSSKLKTPNRSLAVWCLKKNPALFGVLKTDWASGEGFEDCLNIAKNTHVQSTVIWRHLDQVAVIRKNDIRPVINDRISLTNSVLRLAHQTQINLGNTLRGKTIVDKLSTDLECSKLGQFPHLVIAPTQKPQPIKSSGGVVSELVSRNETKKALRQASIPPDGIGAVIGKGRKPSGRNMGRER
jgi:hypothetical protein